MKNCFLLIALFGAVLPPAKGQDSLCPGKALNIPFHHYGISIGNSCTFNGIRLNLADKYVNRINGINLTLWISLSKNQQARVNGLSVGVLPAAYIMQPVNIGLIGVGTMYCSRGITLGGIMVGGDVTGLAAAGLGVFADGTRGIMRGVALGGLGVMAPQALSGVSIAGLGVGTEGNINGLAISSAYINSKDHLRGLAITAGYLDANQCSGIVVAGYARSAQMHGLSIALFNRTDVLQGVQLGLLNLAKNNPKGLRILPLINVHIGLHRN